MSEGEKSIMHLLESYITLSTEFKKPKGFYYKSLYHFVKENGMFFKSAPLTSQELDHVLKVKSFLSFEPQPRNCFYNAQLLMLNDSTGKIQYAEGYGNSIIPVNHGWNIINGKVIDLTWKDKNDNPILGEFDSSQAYFGTIFKSSFVRSKMINTGFASSIIDDWSLDYNILKKKFKN